MNRERVVKKLRDNAAKFDRLADFLRAGYGSPAAIAKAEREQRDLVLMDAALLDIADSRGWELGAWPWR